MNSITQIYQDIDKIIDKDAAINLCRVNIINGCCDIFDTYMNQLTDIETTKNMEILFHDKILDFETTMMRQGILSQINTFDLLVFNLNYCRYQCHEKSYTCDNYNVESGECDDPVNCIQAICVDDNTAMTVREKFVIDIKNIDKVMRHMKKIKDSRYYASMIVSAIPSKIISQFYEEYTGERCPVASMRHMDSKFDGIEILQYLKKILNTHSAEFIEKWYNSIKTFETKVLYPTAS